MTISEQDSIFQTEEEGIRRRAQAYILIRLAFDLILLAVLLLSATNGGLLPSYWVIAADLAGLVVYWFAVRRWPSASTYLALIYAALLVIVLDFSLGRVFLLPWLLLIPLSLAGGIIVPRPGFNSLVTLSIFAIFSAYLALLYLNRFPLTMALPNATVAAFAAALGLVLLFLSALIEILVVQQFNNQQTLLQTRVQLLNALRELEHSSRQLSEIQRQTRQVERRSAIGQIAAQLSKSLRSPFETIQAALRLPVEEMGQPEIVNELQTEVETALRLIDDLKHFARLDQLHIQTVNLDDLLADELARIQLPENVTLDIRQPPVFPPIQGDRKHMQLLIHHLLDNALQAVEHGGAISVHLEPSPEGVRLTIGDTGPGIPDDQLPLIFEPLYTTQQQKIGLGLAICQRIVQMQGGEITVESEVGAGTTFTVNLPRVPRHPPGELAQDVAG